MKKIKPILGYFLILVGILLPLPSLVSMSLGQLKGPAALENYVKEAKPMDSTLQGKVKAYNKEIDARGVNFVDPFRNRDYKRFYGISQDEDAVFAYIAIPKLNTYLPIRLGAGEDHLAIGAAHVDGTHLPVGGASTRAVIAGHRAAVRELFFYNINLLNPGDPIQIIRGNETLNYEVVDQEEISYTAWDKLAPVKGEDLLTLLTCMPFGQEPEKRLIVNARRSSQEVMATSEPNQEATSKPLKKDEGTKGSQAQAIAVDPALKKQELLIYGATLLGIVLFLFTLMKFIKTLRKHK